VDESLCIALTTTYEVVDENKNKDTEKDGTRNGDYTISHKDFSTDDNVLNDEEHAFGLFSSADQLETKTRAASTVSTPTTTTTFTTNTTSASERSRTRTYTGSSTSMSSSRDETEVSPQSSRRSSNIDE